MPAPAETSRHIALRVHDQERQAFDVQLSVNETIGRGSLTILTPDGQIIQQVELANLRRSQDGKTFTCRVGITTVTLKIEGASEPLQLHIAARAFVPLFNATYTLSGDDQQRLRTWIKTSTLID